MDTISSTWNMNICVSFNMQGSVLSGQLQQWRYAVEISEWLTDFIAQFLPKNLFF